MLNFRAQKAVKNKAVFLKFLFNKVFYLEIILALVLLDKLNNNAFIDEHFPFVMKDIGR